MAKAGKPLLGICVGMQAMMARSEENNGVDCLGIFDGQVTFFGEQFSDTGARLKVPHMGWNQVQQGMAHPMWAGIDNHARFYFVHSYCVTGLPDEAVAGRCDYGLSFAAAAVQGNVFAVQFHPEKSADAGSDAAGKFPALAAINKRYTRHATGLHGPPSPGRGRRVSMNLIKRF